VKEAARAPSYACRTAARVEFVRGRIAAVVLAVVGLLLAASVGFAAYYASRDSVGLPVTKLEPTPRHLAPTVRTHTSTTARTTTVEDQGGTTTDDNSGRGRGGSNSGHGGRRGGDD
jgi:hypothetical protein